MFDKLTELIQTKPRAALNFAFACAVVLVGTAGLSLFKYLRSDGRYYQDEIKTLNKEHAKELNKKDSAIYAIMLERVREKSDELSSSKADRAKMENQLGAVVQELQATKAELSKVKSIQSTKNENKN